MRVCLITPDLGSAESEYPRTAYVRDLIRRLQRTHEVVHLQIPKRSHPGFVSWTTFGRVIRSRWSKRFDVIHAFGARDAGAVGLLASRLLGTPMMVHVMGRELVALPQFAYGDQCRSRDRLCVRSVLRGARLITVPSSTMRVRVPPSPAIVECVPIGVDRSLWPVREPISVAEAPYRLMHAGCATRVKNPEMLLAALAYLRRTDFPITLDVVGPDRLEGEMQRRAQQLGVSDVVTFHGVLPQDEFRNLLSRSHLFVHTSIHETGPQTVREAAMLGVPSIGTDVGHVAEWAPEEGAIVVRADDVAGCATAIKELLRDDERRVRIARVAQHTAMTQDLEWTVKRFDDLYARARAGR